MQHTSASSTSSNPAVASTDYTSPALPIAWQPIRDVNGNLAGHEIFNRSRTASAHTIDSDLALAHAVLSHIQPSPLLDNSRLFLNTTYESLGGTHLSLLPASRIVLEIPSLGHAASSEVEARRPALEALRAKGFALAFNHSVLNSAYTPWHDLVNYLKIDFSILTAERAVLMIHWARRIPGATLIADKIESAAQLQLAQENTVDLLQGYAVSRPEPILARVVLPTTLEIDELMTALHEPFNIALIARKLHEQPALLFNLLRMACSQGLEWRATYTSIEQLVTAMGIDTLRAWATMLQAVATETIRSPAAKRQYSAQRAHLEAAAQTAWPDVPAASLQLVSHALLQGHMLGLTLPQSAKQLLPISLAEPVQALEAPWTAMLQAL
ncbi:MAG: EAL domain-containing protein [Comamonas sp.]